MAVKLTDESLMPFGAFKGKKLANVPDKSLLWYWNQTWFDKTSPIGLYIAENLDAIKKNCS